MCFNRNRSININSLPRVVLDDVIDVEHLLLFVNVVKIVLADDDAHQGVGVGTVERKRNDSQIH